jgi:hypothetical protein
MRFVRLCVVNCSESLSSCIWRSLMSFCLSSAFFCSSSRCTALSFSFSSPLFCCSSITAFFRTTFCDLICESRFEIGLEEENINSTTKETKQPRHKITRTETKPLHTHQRLLSVSEHPSCRPSTAPRRSLKFASLASANTTKMVIYLFIGINNDAIYGCHFSQRETNSSRKSCRIRTDLTGKRKKKKTESVLLLNRLLNSLYANNERTCRFQIL